MAVWLLPHRINAFRFTVELSAAISHKCFYAGNVTASATNKSSSDRSVLLHWRNPPARGPARLTAAAPLLCFIVKITPVRLKRYLPLV